MSKDLLASEGPFTVLVPPDDAFTFTNLLMNLGTLSRELEQSTNDDQSEEAGGFAESALEVERKLLKDIAMYHVLDKEVRF